VGTAYRHNKRCTRMQGAVRMIRGATGAMLRSPRSKGRTPRVGQCGIEVVREVRNPRRHVSLAIPAERTLAPPAGPGQVQKSGCSTVRGVARTKPGAPGSLAGIAVPECSVLRPLTEWPGFFGGPRLIWKPRSFQSSPGLFTDRRVGD